MLERFYPTCTHSVLPMHYYSNTSAVGHVSSNTRAPCDGEPLQILPPYSSIRPRILQFRDLEFLECS